MDTANAQFGPLQEDIFSCSMDSVLQHGSLVSQAATRLAAHSRAPLYSAERLEGNMNERLSRDS